MSNIFSKLRDFVGLNDPVEYDYEYEEEGDGYRHQYQPETAQTTSEEDTRQRRRLREKLTTDVGVGTTLNNVIGMPGSTNGVYEVILMEPRSFEEMPEAIQALREGKSVVINLTMMDPDQAQRAVDFVAGGTYAINGHQERVGESIFLFTPICVQVTTPAGTSHEAPQTQIRTRTTVTNGSWKPDSTKIAQSS